MLRRLTVVGLCAVLAVMAFPAAASAAHTESTNGPLGFFALNDPVQVLAPTQIAINATTDFTVGVPITHTASVASATFQVRVNGVNTSGTGTLAAYSADISTPPNTASLEFNAGQDDVQLVTSAVSSSGGVRLRNRSTNGNVEVAVFLVGYTATQATDSGGSYYGAYRSSHGVTIRDSISIDTPTFTNGNYDVPVQVTGLAGVPTGASMVSLRVSAKPGTGSPATAREALILAGTHNSWGFDRTLDFREDLGGSRTTTIDLNTSGGFTLRVPQTSGTVSNVGLKTTLMVDVIGWYDAPIYSNSTFTPATPTLTNRTVSLASGLSPQLDLRGWDGIPVRTDCPGTGSWTPTGTECVLAARMALVTHDATVDGWLNVDGTPQVRVKAGQTTTNAVVMPLDRGTGRTPTIEFVPTSGSGTVGLDMAVEGWWEHSRYTYSPVSAPVAARHVAIAPQTVFSSTGWGTPANTPVLLDASALTAGAVPAHGVSHVTVSVNAFLVSQATSITAYAPGGAVPVRPQVFAQPGRRDAVSISVPVGDDGKIAFVLSAASYFSVTVDGYETPYIADTEPSTAPAVALIGDSITEGLTSVYQEELQPTVRLNAHGRSGHASWQMRWWANELRGSHPDFIILNIGTNDSYVWGMSTTEVRELANTFDSSACKVIVTINHDGDLSNAPTIPHWGRAATIDNELTTLAASRTDIALVDWAQYLIDNEVPGDGNAGYLKADGIHPTPAGKSQLSALYRDAISGTQGSYVNPCG